MNQISFSSGFFHFRIQLNQCTQNLLNGLFSIAHIQNLHARAVTHGVIRVTIISQHGTITVVLRSGVRDGKPSGFQFHEVNILFKQTYLKTIHNQLSALFNYAVRFYGLKSNPARLAGNMGKEEVGEMKFWTKEEYLTFSRAMMNKEESYHAFEILYWCGIRLGELLALTAEDFDFEKKTLRINKSYQRIKGKDVITTPKTKKSNRVLTLPDFLAEEMQDYISRLPYLKVDDRIFTITKSGLHHEIDRGCRETGVKRIRVHDLRHSHVSMLIEMGFSAVDIANRVGHESVKVTYRYAHMFPNKDLMIAKKLNISRNGEKDEQEKSRSERTFEK